ncbi:hypothetical protein Pyrfu_0532 [Pyrolobus fumarii 1A]|uniref:Uncharacterized protein n=1 Tax=Pyrolobus fumarii (strain DSM 11204 / 1A) TaxID=694429 RepID=G0EGM9_PYRF1|nr:hypothetical protein Pyrfu_0532 [Pyrolobus fumarii 1A]
MGWLAETLALWPVHLVLGGFELPAGTVLVALYLLLLWWFADDTLGLAPLSMFVTRANVLGDAFWAGLAAVPLGLVAGALGAHHAAAALLTAPVGGLLYLGIPIALLGRPSDEGWAGASAAEAAVAAAAPLLLALVGGRLPLDWFLVTVVSAVLAPLLWVTDSIEWLWWKLAQYDGDYAALIADEVLVPIGKRLGLELAVELARSLGLTQSELERARRIAEEKLRREWEKRRRKKRM